MTNSSIQREIAPPQTYSSRASADSFGLYHDMIKSSGATASRIGDTFEANIAAHHFGRLTLFDRQMVGACHRRDPTQIRRDGFEHYYIQVLRSGRMVAGRSGEERRLAPGDAIVFDATQPMGSIVEDADYVTAILSRDLVEAAAPDARHLHGRILPRGGVGSLGEVILSMTRIASNFSDASTTGSSQILTSILSKIQGRSDADDRDAFGEDDLELSRRLKAELFIENNLAADLSADFVARNIGVSRSSLYRAMGVVGGVQTVVMRRRAARLRSLILEPDKRVSIAHFAERVGFLSVGHGSRVFKQIYGQSPGQLRAKFLDHVRSEDQALHPERMRDWYGAMND